MDEGQRQSVGAVIRTLREAMGMTRQELSDASSPHADERVSVEMIAKVEQGRKAPSARTLRKLAAGLGMEPLELSSSAARWEAAAAAGARLWDLRAALMGGSAIVGGSLGRAAIAAGPAGLAGLAIVPGASLSAAAVAGGLALHEARERAELRRRLEALVERGSAEDVKEALATLDKVLPEALDAEQ